MPVKGMDISNHQAGMDVERVVRDNDFGFVFILTNDGTFVNRYFHAQADAAERAGAIVRPYTYLRPNWSQTIDVHLGVVGGRYRDSIVDVEDGSGGWHETWSAHNKLWDWGQDTNLLYWPNFHWSAMGKPDLSPLAEKVRGHWKSWYPDREWDWFDRAYGKVPAHPWNDNRGGIPVSVLQFTGTGRVHGYGSHVDLNLFPGSLEELADLLGDDVSATDVWKHKVPLFPNAEDPDQRTETDAAEALGRSVQAGWAGADYGQLANTKLDMLLGRDPVDEVELAKELIAQGLGTQLGRMPDDQFAALVKATVDEHDRRAKARAGVKVPPAGEAQPL